MTTVQTDGNTARPGDQPDTPLIAVGMSGGVDSSTAAALLLSQGLRVVGLTMQLWDQRRQAQIDPAAPTRVEGRCCSGNDVYDARRVAEHLDFPFYVMNFERQFEQTVIRPFVSEYLNGRTPIPCALCNNHVKFDHLLATARQIGAERLATGHYARVEHCEESGRYLLRRAVDESKDQSYFLFGLTQDQLARTVFPLGSLTKQQVRQLAEQLSLPVAHKPESQEICFVPGGDYTRFVENYAALDKQSPTKSTEDSAGNIVDRNGTVLAQHGGVHRFTIGQRKGLGIATGSPLYVLSIDPVSKNVTVGEDSELLSSDCSVADVNWIAFEQPPATVRAEVKIRHQHHPAQATLHREEASVRVEFDQPQRALTPGQAAVFYQRDLVLGGGWIKAASSSAPASA